MPTSVGSGIYLLCETSLWRRGREAARWSAAADAPELLAHQSLPCLPPTSTPTPTSRSTTTRIACSSVLLQHIIRIILDARNVHQHEFVKDDDWHERNFFSSSFWNLTRLTLMRSAVFIPTNLVCALLLSTRGPQLWNFDEEQEGNVQQEWEKNRQSNENFLLKYGNVKA